MYVLIPNISRRFPMAPLLGGSLPDMSRYHNISERSDSKLLDTLGPGRGEVQCAVLLWQADTGQLSLLNPGIVIQFYGPGNLRRGEPPCHEWRHSAGDLRGDSYRDIATLRHGGGDNTRYRRNVTQPSPPWIMPACRYIYICIYTSVSAPTGSWPGHEWYA